MRRITGPQQYLERITDPRLLQKIPLLMLVASTTTVHLVSSIDLEFSNFEIRIPLTVTSMLPAIILIFLGHKAASKFAKLKFPIIFLFYFVGGLIRGFILETGLYEFGILNEGATNFRISTGALIVTVCSSIISYFWSTISDARDTIISLHQETQALQQTLEDLAKEIQTQDVEQSLSLFKKITNELSKFLTDSTSDQKKQLENLVNEVVRPLSRNYAPKKILEIIVVLNTPKITWRGVWQLFDPVRHLPSFQIVVWVLAIAAAVPVRRIYGWATAIELGLLVLVSLSISLFLINPIAQRTLDKFKSPLRDIVMTLGFVLVAIPPSFATTIALRNTPNPYAYLIPGIITLPLFSWVLTIGNAAWEYSQKLKTNLEATREQQRWLISRFNLISWYKNGLISRLLHGPIQNNLQVAIMRIRAGDNEGDNSNIIQTVIQRIEQAIAGATDENRSAQNDLASMNDAIKAWKSVADIQIKLDAKCESVLIKDPAGCAIFTDIVMEVCSNAIRHGKSTQLLIDYRITSAGIELKVIDNGLENESNSDSGLGAELLTSCTIWLKRSRLDGLNELALELPLGNQPPIREGLLSPV